MALGWRRSLAGHGGGGRGTENRRVRRLGLGGGREQRSGGDSETAGWFQIWLFVTVCARSANRCRRCFTWMRAPWPTYLWPKTIFLIIRLMKYSYLYLSGCPSPTSLSLPVPPVQIRSLSLSFPLPSRLSAGYPPRPRTAGSLLLPWTRAHLLLPEQCFSTGR